MSTPLASPTDADDPLAAKGYQLPTQLLLMLRAYFQPGQPKWIPSLNRLVWNGAEGAATRAQAVSTIDIQRMGEETGETNSTLPKILLRRDPIANATIGLKAGINRGGIPNGGFEKIRAGAVVLFCCSRDFGESELLGFEMFDLFGHFEDHMRQKLCLRKFRCSQLGTVGRLRGFPGFFATPVTLEYAYTELVQISSKEFPLREIHIEIK